MDNNWTRNYSFPAQAIFTIVISLLLYFTVVRQIRAKINSEFIYPVIVEKAEAVNAKVVFSPRRVGIIPVGHDSPRGFGIPFGHVFNGLRGPDAGHHIFALRVDQELAIELVLASGWVAGERNPGAGVVAGVAEHHGLHVDRGAIESGDAFDPAIRQSLVPVPALEDGFDGGFHLQVVVGDQRFQTQGLRRSPQGPSHHPAVASQPHHLKAHFIPRHTGSSQSVSAIGKNEDPLARKVR